jgi:L-fuconolactonase
VTVVANGVDAHHHLWAAGRGYYGWTTSGEVPGGRWTAAPADLEPMLRRYGIARTVVVQAAPVVTETDDLLELAAATGWIARVVGWVDFEQSEHRRHVDRFAAHPKFAGLRPMLQDIADPTWVLRPDVQWAFRAIVELDLTFDVLGYAHHLDPLNELFRRFPGMRAVIDHCLKPSIRTGAFRDWATGIERIATSHSHLFCKLSGLATEAAPGWEPETLAPYVEHVLDCFGPERVMWGSDWPVLESNGTYEGWRTTAAQLVRGGRAAEHVFGESAAAFYRIQLPSGRPGYARS